MATAHFCCERSLDFPPVVKGGKGGVLKTQADETAAFLPLSLRAEPSPFLPLSRGERVPEGRVRGRTRRR